jgi:hypothetical protein
MKNPSSKRFFNFIFLSLLIIFLALYPFNSSQSLMNFYLIDNFEDGNTWLNPEWWEFDRLNLVCSTNGKDFNGDLIGKSVEKYSLNMSGKADNWYVGGLGASLKIDAADYSRFQIDLFGNMPTGGRIKIELFDDDNGNGKLEQDEKNHWSALYDDKWIAEAIVGNKGWTRVSIPFTAFVDDNPAVGDNIWNPFQKDGSAGLLQIQVIVLGSSANANIDFNVDNLLLVI